MLTPEMINSFMSVNMETVNIESLADIGTLEFDNSLPKEKRLEYVLEKALTRSKVGGNVYYYCRTYKDRSKTACTKHTIRHNDLENGVLYAVKKMVYVAAEFSEIVSRINTAPMQKSQSIRLNELIAAKEKELSKIMRYNQSIYQDWKDGEITHKDYRNMRRITSGKLRQ